MDEKPAAGEPYGGDPQKLHATLLEKVRGSKSARSRQERDWYIQREFHRGRQYAVLADNIGIIENPPNPKRKPRMINNLVRPAVEVILSYLLRQDPSFTVMPKTGEPEDQNGALVARAVLFHYWGLLKLARKLKLTGYYVADMCAGFWKITWDPLAGPKVPIMERREIPPSPEAMLQAAETGVLPESEVEDVQVGEQPAGDVRIDLLSPFEYLNDPTSETMEDSRWGCHYMRRPVSEMKKRSPAHAETLHPDEGDEMSGQERQVHQSFGAGAGGGGGLSASKTGMMTVWEFWGRACEEWPEGLRATFTRERVLEAGPTPQGHADLPFAMWCGRLVPGEFWPDAYIHDAIPLQKEHNKALSQLVLVRQRFKTYWTAPVGSIDEEQITDEDSQIIEHQPGQAPESHAPPPLPEALLKSLEMSKEAIENVTGATAVLQGVVSGEVRSGRQVAYQGQYAEGRISLDAKELAWFFQDSGKMILELVQTYVTEPRVARVVGRNRDVEVKNFKGADIHGQTDVVVDPGTLLSFSKSERFNMLKEMETMKLLPPGKFLELMEISDFSAVMEDVAQDRNNAQRENEAWRQGQPADPPQPWDNHQMHLNGPGCHNYFRKSGTYRTLPPEAQQAVNEHCAYHEKMLMQLMGPMPGPGGEGGAGVGDGNLPPEPVQGKPPPTPAEMQGYMDMDESQKQSGQEIAEGLPPVPPVADIGGPGKP